MPRKKGSWGKNPKIQEIQEFPKLPQELDRRKKLMDYEIEAIRKEYAKKHQIKKLAEKYAVSQTTIKYYVYDSYREYCKERDKKRNRVAEMGIEAVRRGKQRSREYCINVFKPQHDYMSLRRRKLRQSKQKKVN
jgi:hypothetical protein